jgi:hypothetical protein
VLHCLGFHPRRFFSSFSTSARVLRWPTKLVGFRRALLSIFHHHGCSFFLLSLCFNPLGAPSELLTFLCSSYRNEKKKTRRKKPAGYRTYDTTLSRLRSRSHKSRAEDALDHGANVASIIRVDVEGQGDDDVGAEAHAALEVVALAVSDEVVDDQHGEEEDDGLEALEVQGHGLADDPAEDDEEGSDEQGDLHAAADRDANGQVHLVLVRDDAGGDVLGGVADDGQEDQTNEGLADV